MVISAQISIYPLRQNHLSPAIDVVYKTLAARGLHAEIGPMSTLVTGEAEAVFAALQEAFRTYRREAAIRPHKQRWGM
jgi:uncharacterized protein YqgV (UPF0045/DUF77 family)